MDTAKADRFDTGTDSMKRAGGPNSPGLDPSLKVSGVYGRMALAPGIRVGNFPSGLPVCLMGPWI